MLQKIVTAALVLVGLVLAGLGVASGTVWRPSDTVTLSSGAHDSATLLMTEPGVLGLVDDDVTIEATGPAGTSVVLAIGRASDVAGWVGTDAVVVVTGASDWETLSVDEREAAPADTAAPTDPAVPADPAATADPAAPAEEAAVVPPDPAGSDMWIVESSGEAEARLEWSGTSSDQVLLAATVGDTTEAPVVSLTWPREVTTPWMLPGVALGMLLLLTGLVLGYLWFVAGPRRDRRREVVPARPRTARAAAGGPSGAGTDGDHRSPSVDSSAGAPALTSSTAGLTRRELREMAERAHATPDAEVSEAPTKPRRSWPWTGAMPTVSPRGEGRSGPRTAAVPVVAPEPETHRPGWMPEGATSSSGSGWRQAWGVRPGASSPDAQPLPDTATSGSAAALPAATAWPTGAGSATARFEPRPVDQPVTQDVETPASPAARPPADRPDAARPSAARPDAGTGPSFDPRRVQGPPPRGGGVRRRPPVEPDRTPTEEHEEDR